MPGSRSATSATPRSCSSCCRSATSRWRRAIPTGRSPPRAGPRGSGAGIRAVNLPNFITLARLLSVPVAVWLILVGEFAAAFWVFVAAGVSDALDGFIAKRFDQRTRLGALLDPIADKSLLVAVYVTLGVAGELPAW